ncbi:MAG: MFS transporter [Acidimicrobiales bacterium]
MTSPQTAPVDATVPTSLRRSGFATATLFLVNGATFSNWLPRISEIRDRLGLGNAGLGVTLLGGGLGGVIGALLVGRVSERLGSSRLLSAAAITLSLGMPLIAFAPHAVVLLALLTLLGTFDVFNDVAMNTQAVMVQERSGRQIMNRLHGMWSLGFTGGALLGSLARAAEIGIRWHLAVVGAVLLTTVLTCRRWFIPDDPVPHPHPHARPDHDGHPTPAPARRRPNAAMVAMALAAVGAITLEVTPNDWAAVFFNDVFDAGRVAGFGTVACAGAMLVGRLAGDHVLERLGEHRMTTLSFWLIGVGLVVTVVAPWPAVAVGGLVVWGLGLAPVFPLLYTTAARLPGTSAGAGLGWMLLGQRFGAMLTAVSIGGVSQLQGMRTAFGVVAGAALALMLVSLREGSAAAERSPAT